MSTDTIYVDNLDELPWNSFEEISKQERDGNIRIGIFKDTSRQWLTESPDAPSRERKILNILLFMSGIGFPVILVIFAWMHLSWFSLILLLPLFLAFVYARPTTFSTFSSRYYYLVFSLFILLIVFGKLINVDLIWLFGLSIIGPWIFNILQYKFSCYYVKILVLENKNLFYHFFKASELVIWDLDNNNKYFYKTFSPTPPQWFFDSYKSKNKGQKESINFNKKKKSYTQTNLNNNLPINKLLYLILRNFRSIESIDDLIQLLPDNCLKDISDSEIVRQMNAVEPNIEGHINKFFQFIETEGIHGELDMDFIENKLMNVRIQLFFNKTKDNGIKEIDKDNYMKNIKKLIEELSEVNLDDKVYPYYNYSAKSKEELVIGIRKVLNTESISITICEDTPMEDIPIVNN